MTDRTKQTDAARADGSAMVALFLGAVLIGASPIFVRLSELGPMATAFYRPFLAIPVLMLWMTIDQTKNPQLRRPAKRSDYLRLLLAGAFFSGDLAFWHLSIMNTSVANATLFANFAPIFVTFGAWLLFSHRVTRQYLLGLTLALAGAAILAGGSFAIAPENLLGDFFGVVTAMFLACYILAISRLRTGFSTATTMAWSSIGTAAVLLPVALLSGEEMIAVTLYGWMILAGLALLSHAAGQGAIAYALAHLPPGFSSVGLLLEPVAAALLAWIILAEAITPWQATGGAVILWGIVMARRGSR
ncbi:MAG: DMT family transporter [Alphaproteobacteria bacterium]|nr:DMT family transporter [Alphaproteobacteria bacterium]